MSVQIVVGSVLGTCAEIRVATVTKRRMTATSRENVKVAEKAELVPLDVGWGVKVWKGGKAAFVSSPDGPMVYPTRTLARRAVRRIRRDLQPTEI
jgi:hypothetical protein